MMYLSALKLRDYIGYGTISNVSIPIFGIELPDVPLEPRIGIHDRGSCNGRTAGLVPFRGYATVLPKTNASFISLEGFYQNIDNFPAREKLDYDALFPHLPDQLDHASGGELLISIRGGDVLRGIHPHYTLLPAEFYAALARQTGLRPVFFGQLENNAYMDELRSRFPNARFVQGRDPGYDFDYIRKSKNIVLSVSTFAWLAAWLSDAAHVFFPISGMFNPAQHPSSMLIPWDDPRFHFYLFPKNYALPVERYREYIDPLRDTWTGVSAQHRDIYAKPPRRSLDKCLMCFNVDDYCEMYPNARRAGDLWGAAGVVNEFVETGFWEGRRPCIIDDAAYCRKNPMAAIDLSRGLYEDEVHHYTEVGQFLGLPRS